MSQEKHPLDNKIIALLQQRGMIKSEAKTRLKKQVYKLQASEVNQINNYSNHFGLTAKQKLIDEILDIRREAMISSLTSEKGRV